MSFFDQNRSPERYLAAASRLVASMYLTLITDNGPSVLLSAHTRRVNTNQGSSAPKHDLESRLAAQLDEPMKAFSSLKFSPPEPQKLRGGKSGRGPQTPMSRAHCLLRRKSHSITHGNVLCAFLPCQVLFIAVFGIQNMCLAPKIPLAIVTAQLFTPQPQ